MAIQLKAGVIFTVGSGNRPIVLVERDQSVRIPLTADEAAVAMLLVDGVASTTELRRNAREQGVSWDESVTDVFIHSLQNAKVLRDQLDKEVERGESTDIDRAPTGFANEAKPSAPAPAPAQHAGFDSNEPLPAFDEALLDDDDDEYKEDTRVDGRYTDTSGWPSGEAEQQPPSSHALYGDEPYVPPGGIGPDDATRETPIGMAPGEDPLAQALAAASQRQRPIAPVHTGPAWPPAPAPPAWNPSPVTGPMEPVDPSELSEPWASAVTGPMAPVDPSEVSDPWAAVTGPIRPGQGSYPGAYHGTRPGTHPGSYPGSHPGSHPGMPPGPHYGTRPGTHPGYPPEGSLAPGTMLPGPGPTTGSHPAVHWPEQSGVQSYPGAGPSAAAPLPAEDKPRVDGALLARAVTLMRDKRYDEARALLDTVIEIDPNNATATALLEAVATGRRGVGRSRIWRWIVLLLILLALGGAAAAAFIVRVPDERIVDCKPRLLGGSTVTATGGAGVVARVEAKIGAKVKRGDKLVLVRDQARAKRIAQMARKIVDDKDLLRIMKTSGTTADERRLKGIIRAGKAKLKSRKLDKEARARVSAEIAAAKRKLKFTEWQALPKEIKKVDAALQKLIADHRAAKAKPVQYWVHSPAGGMVRTLVKVGAAIQPRQDLGKLIDGSAFEVHLKKIDRQPPVGSKVHITLDEGSAERVLRGSITSITDKGVVVRIKTNPQGLNLEARCRAKLVAGDMSLFQSLTR